jgi:hypothetical protein
MSARATDPPLQIDVETLWNGRPATARERVIVLFGGDEHTLEITIDAQFHGDPAPDAPAGRLDGLWEHEVVEVFIGGAGSRYIELEFGPYGHHLALALDPVRVRVEEDLPVRFRTLITRDLWSGRATLGRALLPPGPHTLNVTAIHGRGPRRRHLSWRPLPGAVPDFHQPAAWAPVTLPGAPAASP